ncbi:MAG: hypothetical protein AAGL99_04955 [Pseudomonadota bacterium]
MFRATAPNEEWLMAAILSVANAAANAANSMIEKDHALTEITLVERIATALEKNPAKPTFDRRVPVVGKSGRAYEFDFALRRSGVISTLIDSVSPHHTSIAAKYVAFDDTERRPTLEKFAVYERELEKENKVLMQNVADLIPIEQVESDFGAAFLNL